MARISGIDLPREKRIEVALTYIYGIGPARAAKVLRSETRVAAKLLAGDQVLNSELRRDLAYLSQHLQSNNLGG